MTRGGASSGSSHGAAAGMGTGAEEEDERREDVEGLEGDRGPEDGPHPSLCHGREMEGDPHGPSP